MTQLAAAFGTFIGYALGHTLRIAGPELQKFLVGCIRDALSSKVEVSKPNDPLQSVADGLLRSNEGDIRASGYSDDSSRVDQGREGSSSGR